MAIAQEPSRLPFTITPPPPPLKERERKSDTHLSITRKREKEISYSQVSYVYVWETAHFRGFSWPSAQKDMGRRREHCAEDGKAFFS